MYGLASEDILTDNSSNDEMSTDLIDTTLVLSKDKKSSQSMGAGGVKVELNSFHLFFQ